MNITNFNTVSQFWKLTCVRNVDKWILAQSSRDSMLAASFYLIEDGKFTHPRYSIQ